MFTLKGLSLRWQKKINHDTYLSKLLIDVCLRINIWFKLWTLSCRPDYLLCFIKIHYTVILIYYFYKYISLPFFDFSNPFLILENVNIVTNLRFYILYILFCYNLTIFIAFIYLFVDHWGWLNINLNLSPYMQTENPFFFFC